jgi:hypothetical protein
MEPEGSLPSLQELSTCTYPEPNQFSPQHYEHTRRNVILLNSFTKTWQRDRSRLLAIFYCQFDSSAPLFDGKCTIMGMKILHYLHFIFP